MSLFLINPIPIKRPESSKTLTFWFTYGFISVKSPLYEKARKGQEIKEIPSRVVTIYNIEVIDYDFPRLMIDITCSSGTYVRSLVRDIAEDLGTVAYMSLLIRTKSGEFDIENSITLEEIGSYDLEKNLILISDICVVYTIYAVMLKM